MVFTGLALEAYVGVLISVFIIKSGLEMMGETLGEILGQRSDSEVTGRIKDIVCETPGVLRAYDLVINNYGPGRDYASIHMEMDSGTTAEEIDVISQDLQVRVYQETGVTLAAIGVYSVNNTDPVAAGIRKKVLEIASSHEWVLQIHAFHVDTDSKRMRFDAVLSFDVDHAEAIRTLCSEVSEIYPDYICVPRSPSSQFLLKRSSGIRSSAICSASRNSS